MFQLNKKTVIFLCSFSVVLVLITVGAIFYTNSHDTSDSSQIIIEGGEKDNSKEKVRLTNDGVKGIQLSDTYKINDLKIFEIKYNPSENSKNNIVYFSISGLNDETIENKINEEIKNKVFSLYDEEKKNNRSADNINIIATCYGNFSDVLSIQIYGFVSNNGNYKNYYDGLNYRLDTGDKIKLKDLFTYNTGIKNIISECAYKSFAWNYQTDNIENTNMDSIDYSGIEEEVYKFVKYYSNNSDIKFFFDEKDIYIVNNDKTCKIHMLDYSDNIAIYNRFVSGESLYKNDYYKLENIPVLIKIYNGKYGMYYEDDNCVVSMYLWDSEYTEYYKDIMLERIDEIKKEASSSGNGIYFESYITKSGEENDIINMSENYMKYSASKNDYKKYVYDKVLETKRSEFSELQFATYVIDERRVTREIGMIKKTFDKNSKKEIVEEENNEPKVEEQTRVENENTNNQNTTNNDNNGVVVDNNTINTNTDNNNNKNADNNTTNDNTHTSGNNTTNSVDTIITIE